MFLARLKLTAQGDPDGLLVPLPFADRAQLEQFAAELHSLFLFEGITDAKVVQIGPGTEGWSGNAARYSDYMSRGGTEKGWFEYGAWKPGSDTDFVVFSDQALVQAKQVMEHDPQIDVKHRLFKNGEAPGAANNHSGRPGYANAPLGAALLALALKWNKQVCGTVNPPAGGFDFKLNLDINMNNLSKPVTVCPLPGSAAAGPREMVTTLERTTLAFAFAADLTLTDMKQKLDALQHQPWVPGDSEWHGDYLGGNVTAAAVARFYRYSVADSVQIYSGKDAPGFHVDLRFVDAAGAPDARAKLSQAERILLERTLPAIGARAVQPAGPLD